MRSKTSVSKYYIVSKVFVCLLLVFSSLEYDILAQSWVTISTGPWNAGSNWVGGAVPLATSNVIIDHKIFLRNDEQCSRLTISAGEELTVGNFTFLSGTIGGDGKIVVNGGIVEGTSFTVNALVADANSTIEVAKDWGVTNFSGTGSIVKFIGTSRQNVFSQTIFDKILINNSSGISLNKNIRVEGELNILNGNIYLNDFNLVLGPNAFISGNYSNMTMIVTNGSGKIIKEFPDGTPGLTSFILPVGTSNLFDEYSPVELSFTASTFTGASVSASAKPIKHPENKANTDYIKRFWSLSKSGTITGDCDVTFEYLASDIVGLNESQIFLSQSQVSGWVKYNAANIISKQLTGKLSTFSDFTGIEKIIPTATGVTMISDNPFNNYLARPGDRVTLSVTTSEDIQTPNVIVGTGNAILTGTGNNWTANRILPNSTPEGKLTFTLDFKDLADNQALQVTSLTAGNYVTFDKTAPTLSSVHLSSSGINPLYAKENETVNMRFSANEPLISLPVISFFSGGENVFNNVPEIMNAGELYTASYKVNSTDKDGNISFIISFNDLAGNAGTPVRTTTDGSAVKVDKLGPNLNPVTIVSNNVYPYLAKETESVTLTFKTSENLSLSPKVEIFGHTVSSSTIGINTYQAKYELKASDPNGQINFRIICTDIGENASTVTTVTSGAMVTYDNSAPSLLVPVTISSDNKNSVSLAKPGDKVFVDFEANEELQSFPTVVISGIPASVSNRGGYKFRGEYMMTATETEGKVVFSISYTDKSGNPGPVVNTITGGSNVTFDKTPPLLNPVSIGTLSVDPTVASENQTITLRFTSSEALSTISEFSFFSGGESVTQVVPLINVSGEYFTYSYKVSNTDQEGMVSFLLNYFDLAGNPGLQVTKTSDGSFVRVDKTASSLNQVAISSDNFNTTLAKLSDIVTLSFKLSESPSSIPVTSIGLNIVPVSDLGSNNYQAQYTLGISDPEGIIPFSIKYSDLAGNSSTVTTITAGSMVTYDKTTPALNPVIAITDNHNYNNLAKIGDKVILSFQTSEQLSGFPTVTIASHPALVVDKGNNDFDASYQMSVSDVVTTIPFNINFSDKAGNTGLAVSTVTAGSNVTFDKITPVLNNVRIKSSNILPSIAKDNETVSLLFTSSESLYSFPTVVFLSGGETVNQTVPYISISGDNYTFSYKVASPDINGKVSFSINFSDRAGNLGNTVTKTTDGSYVNVDRSGATLYPVTIESNNSKSKLWAKTGEKVTLKFTSNKVLSATPTVNFRSGGIPVAGLVTIIPGTYPNEYIASYFANIIDNSGNISFTVNYTDNAGHAGVENTTTAGEVVTFDNTPPSITSVVIPSAPYKVGDIVKVSIHADQPNYSLYQFTINGFTYPDSRLNYSYTGGTLYSVNYTVANGDPVVASINSSVILEDLAGNRNPVFNTNHIGASINTVLPRVTVYPNKLTACAGDELTVALSAGTPPWQFSDNYGIHSIPANTFKFILSTPGIYQITDVWDASNNHISPALLPAAKTVYALTPVTFIINPGIFPATLDPPYITLSASASITALPVGGVFSGPGVVPINDRFYPKDAGIGTHALTYSITDINGCTNFANEDVTVTAQLDYITGYPNTEKIYCPESLPSQLTGNNHLSNIGTFSITGVPGALIDHGDNTATITPGLLTAGNSYTITYEEGVNYKVKDVIKIELVPSPTFIPIPNDYCETSPAFNIIAKNPMIGGSGNYFVNGLLPPSFFGFSYSSGSDIMNMNPLSVALDPSYSPPNEIYTISYVYTTPVGGCLSNPIETDINIQAAPDINFINLNSNYNHAGPPVVLQASPAGGSFSGVGVSGNFLYPNLISPASNVPISYQYTDPFTGCSSTTVEFIDINDPMGTIVNLPSVICFSAAIIPISFNPAPNSFIGVFSSHKGAVINTGPNTANYLVGTAGMGTDTVKVTYLIGTTPYTIKKVVFIDNSGSADFDLNPQYCAGDPPVTLVGKSTQTGGTGNFTMSGTGLVNNGNTAIFDPSKIPPGNTSYTITFTYRSGVPGSTCSATSTKITLIKPLPIVEFVGLESVYNVNGNPIDLRGNFSPAGEFLGQGISFGKLYPSAIGLKTGHPVTYKYTDPITKCSNQITALIDIRESTGGISNLQNVYCYKDTVVQIKYIPSKDNVNITGTFSSKKGGIIKLSDISAQYSLSKAGSGTDTIRFTYYQNDVKFEIIKSVYIDSIGKVDFDLDSSYCSDDPLIHVGSRYSHPQGIGKFSMDTESGFTNYGNTADINPSKVPSSMIPYNLTFTYVSSVASSGCKISKTKKAGFYPVPNLSFSLDKNYSLQTEAILLNAIPRGGFYSGPGVSGNTFYPGLVGSGFDLKIIYNYTDSTTGCSNSISQITNVLKADAVIQGIHPNNTYCIDDKADTLTGSSINGLKGGKFYGEGIINIAPDMAIFNPAIAHNGNHIIKYEYLTKEGTTNLSVTEIIKVDSVEKVSISGLEDKYCLNSKGVQIFGSKGNEGIFSGPGIITGTGNAWFYPTFAGVADIPHKIQFIYSSASGCKSIATKEVKVLSLPIVDFNIKELYNVNENPFILTGVPSGGVFSGRGVIPADNSFLPSIAGISAEINITYSYTDKNNCTNLITKTTSVESPLGKIDGINPNNVYCYDELPGTLTGIPKNGIPGGLFSGKGITNIGNEKAIFNPSLAGNGEHEVKYIYQSKNQSTKFEIQVLLKVDSIGKVSFIGLDSSYCTDHEQTRILAIAPPSGIGNFYGPQTGFINAGNTSFISPKQILPKTEPYQLKYVYTSPLGCQSSYLQTFKVYSLPNVKFETDTIFCANSEGVILVGNPGGGLFSGPGIENFQNYAKFSPGSAIIGNQNLINYIFTEKATGCSNSYSKKIYVLQVPYLSFNIFDRQYCKNQASREITGLINGIKGFGSFMGKGIVDVIQNDGKASFYPDSVDVGTSTIRYTYKDINGCLSNRDTSAIVKGAPIISFAGLLTHDFCKDNTSNPIELVEINPGKGTGKFLINGIPINGSSFKPNDYDGKTTIKYEFVDLEGCMNSYSDNIFIHQVPDFDFDISNKCLDDSVRFNIKNLNNEQIASYKWNFGDNSTSDIVFPKHKYQTTGSRNVSLEIITDKACRSAKALPINITKKPDIDFIWKNDCFGDNLTEFFVNTQDNIKSYDWSFGDNSFSNIKNPSHKYKTEGSFKVSLIARELENECADTNIQVISIRPTIEFKQDPANFYYYQDFEKGDKGWVIENSKSNKYSSWYFGTPNGEHIKFSSSGTNSWFTKIDKNVPHQEKSWISSPCFDMSSLKRPMIKFNYWSDPNSDRDGAVLQYLVDTVWTNIGSLQTGINWYNTLGIFGNPGEQLFRQEGWSENPSNTWVEARHDLNMVRGQKNVRFRIAYGSDGSAFKSPYDGFAFDDIWIGERERNILIENFTNNSSSESAKMNSVLNELINQNKRDLMNIQYHTSFPGEDVFNTHNQHDPSARTLYYGVSKVPWIVINGNQFNRYFESSSSLDTLLKKLTLTDPKVDIDLITNTTSNAINIQANVTPREMLQPDVSVYLVVLEKEISSVSAPNGETRFINVQKKMLPDAGGFNFSNVWNKGESKSVTSSWNYSNIYNIDQLVVLAFVQDEKTKEVYQVVSNDTTSLETGMQSFSTHKDFFTISVYPNPAKENLFVIFNQIIKSDLIIEVIDPLGKRIKSDKLIKGMISYDFNVSRYAPGFYYIRISDDYKTIGAKKFIVRE